jgi:DNA/RNA-binding domain of Phe-tRNA-synthetase-like protein
MTGLTYIISPEIFDKYPSYMRGVVLAFDVHNGLAPGELVKLLRAAEETVRQRISLEVISEHPRIKSWREAYKAFGAKPSEFRSSVEAMARRVLRGDQLPSVNALVDIGNILSLQHLVPVGGHSMDELNQDIVLRFATGEETFIPFGGTAIEHPQPGEVIFTEGNNVLTRRWTWRQANHTLTLPETTSIEINIDRLPPVEIEEIHNVASRLMAMVEQFCQGKTRYEVLNRDHPRMRLSRT